MAACAASLAGGGTARALAANSRRPNIVFILADDLGYGDVSSYGSRLIHTPNIDRLAASGLRFTDGYAGAPVCGPSRCALMTGMHQGHNRIRDNFALAAGDIGKKGAQSIRRAALLPGDRTIADYLREAGYRTGLMGKWHLDGYNPTAVPTRHGFEEFRGWLTQRAETQGYWPTTRMHNDQEQPVPENAGGRHGRYDTDIITDDSCAFLEAHRNEPFFLYTAYDAPHSPYTAPGFGPYADRPGWSDDEKTYASMIDRMDRGIGRIMAKLDELKLRENTIVFFASDNGPRSEPTPAQTRVIDFFDSNGNMTGYKRDMYEGGIREPWIVSWPGTIAPGGTTSAPVFFPDFMPTALALAGAAPKPNDGVDITPLLRDPKHTPATLEDRFLYWEFLEPEFRQAARWGKWKAVRLKLGAKLELYDVSVDRWEETNLAARHPDIVSQIEARMKAAHRESAEYPDALLPTISAHMVP